MFRRSFGITICVVLLFTTSLLNAQAPAPSAFAIAKQPRDPLFVQGNFPDAIQISAKDATGNAVPGVTIRGVVREGDALLYTLAQAPGATVPGVTDANGLATFSVITNAAVENVIHFVPVVGGADLANQILVVTLSGTSNLATSLGSKRAFLQLFMGQTFTNNYEPIPDNTRGETRSTGFGDGGPLIRLTFDTMWRVQPTDTSKAENSWRYGLFHTDANLEFSQFPFGPAAVSDPDPDPQNQKGLDDAFSGSLGLTWQPNRLASYDTREKGDRRGSGDDHPFDAYRFGFFGKVGVTTRATSEPGGNNSINRIQYGLRFTHGRSRHANAVAENRNEVPVRFVEASYARFSEWGGQDSRSRLVIDGGLRINALSNEVFPIYVGTHLNLGPGQDDIRVFLGVLIKLDLLGRLVQSVVPAPE